MPLPAGVVAAIPAIAGFLGGERRNRVDQRQAEVSRQHSSAEAEKSRAFAERMRNTAWQAAVSDMEAAGLNPALAYGQGPAASPGGAMASSAMAGGASDTVSSAMDLHLQKKGLKLLDEQIREQVAKADVGEQQARKESATTSWWLQYGKGRDRAPLFDLLEAELGAAQAGVSNVKAMAERNKRMSDLVGPLSSLFGRGVTPAINATFDQLFRPSGQSGRSFMEYWSERGRTHPLYRRRNR